MNLFSSTWILNYLIMYYHEALLSVNYYFQYYSYLIFLKVLKYILLKRLICILIARPHECDWRPCTVSQQLYNHNILGAMTQKPGIAAFMLISRDGFLFVTSKVAKNVKLTSYSGSDACMSLKFNAGSFNTIHDRVIVTLIRLTNRSVQLDSSTGQ